jgi:hypothetical protein
MMQISKERSETEKAEQSLAFSFRFRKRYVLFNLFSFANIFKLCLPLGAIIFPHLISKTKWDGSDFFTFFMLFFICLDMPAFLWVELPKYLKFYNKYKNSEIELEQNGIFYKNQSQETFLEWHEIAFAYREAGELILIRKGVIEEEIRLPDSQYFKSDDKKATPILSNSLADTIAHYCPLPKEQMWQTRETEELSDPIPRVVSTLGKYNIFTYHTKSQRQGKIVGLLPMVAIGIVGLVTSIILQDWLIGKLTTVLSLLFAIMYGYRWHWCKRSQVETDDTGMALVGPRGTVWHVPWFTVDSFEVGVLNTTLKTKNGKTHKILLGCSRWNQLVTEIENHVTSKTH